MRIPASILLTVCSCGILFAQGAPDIQWKMGGHIDVRRLAYSPDGSTLYTSGLDSTLKVWRVSDGLFMRTIPLPGYDFALSPDGASVAVLGASNRIKHVRIADGALLRTFEPAVTNRSVTFSPGGEYIAASGSASAQMRVWRVSDGQLVATISTPELVDEVEFSPNGQLLAASQYGPGASKNVSFYRTSDWAFVRRINASTNATSGIDFSPDSQTLVWCGINSSVGLWRVSDGAFVRDLGSNPNGYHSQEFSPDGTLVAAAGDSSMGVWRVSDGAQWNNTVDPQGFLRPVFSPNQNALAVVRTYPWWVELRTPAPSYVAVSKRLVEYGRTREHLAITPNGQTIVSCGGGDTEITLTSPSNGATTSILVDPNREMNVASMSVSPDGTTLLVGSRDRIQHFNLATGAMISSFPGRGVGVEHLAFLPGGKSFVTGGGERIINSWFDCRIYVRRAADGAVVSSLSGHNQAIGQLVLAPNGSFLLTSSGEDLKVWTMFTRLPLYTLPAATGKAGFSPDASKIAIPVGNVVDVRRASDSALLRSLSGSSANIACATFTLDGSRIVAGGSDSTIRIWRVSDGALLNFYDVETGSHSLGAEEGVRSIVMAPDGISFYYGRDDATLVKARLPN